MGRTHCTTFTITLYCILTFLVQVSLQPDSHPVEAPPELHGQTQLDQARVVAVPQQVGDARLHAVAKVPAVQLNII